MMRGLGDLFAVLGRLFLVVAILVAIGAVLGLLGRAVFDARAGRPVRLPWDTWRLRRRNERAAAAEKEAQELAALDDPDWNYRQIVESLPAEIRAAFEEGAGGR